MSWLPRTPSLVRYSSLLWFWLILTLVSPALARSELAHEVAVATLELDVERATRLLDEARSAEVPLLDRARLALYRGDCDTAEAALDSPAGRANAEAQRMLLVAAGCAKATAGALIVVDEARGVWIRLQDERDRPLLPYLSEVVVHAREAAARELGVDLPKPLRIDLVRDLFSLSAVTGLPLEAAETTGTLAVARWGRVTMITPRATPRGFAWQDTLAHEITHLALARATRDQAPLWLQEGIAKRVETRWRKERPFDRHPSADQVAYHAMLKGKSVGLGNLGQSIAMLPSPEAASIAYAEVSSFVDYWIEKNGPAALRLLLADLKVVGGRQAAQAVKSVSGYSLAEWDVLWRAHLHESLEGLARLPPLPEPSFQAGSLARWVRLSDLLYDRGHFDSAKRAFLSPVGDVKKGAAFVRWRAARGAIAAGNEAEARELLGEVRDIDMLHGAWFALYGRLTTAGAKQQRTAWDYGLALDPLFHEVACEGFAAHEKRLPADPQRRALCIAARRIFR